MNTQQSLRQTRRRRIRSLLVSGALTVLLVASATLLAGAAPSPSDRSPEGRLGKGAEPAQNDIVTIAPGNPVEVALLMAGFFGPGGVIEAVQMALDDHGPIKGFNLQRNDYDTGCGQATGQASASQAVARAQNVAVVGPFCSGATAGALPVLEGPGVVMVSPTASRNDLPTFGPTVFNRVTVTDDDNLPEWDAWIGGLPSVLAWEAAFQATHGFEPSTFCRYSYDATRLLLTHIEGVSTLDGGNLVVNRAALASAVRGTAGYAGVTGNITLTTDGNRVNEMPPPVLGTRYIHGETGSDTSDCRDSLAPCQTIGYGLQQAGTGDELHIGAGTYPENLVIDGETLLLRGGYAVDSSGFAEGGADTVVDGGHNGRTFYIHDGSTVVLEQMRIRNGVAPEESCWGAGVNVEGAHVTIRHAYIHDNQAVCTSGMSGGGAGGGLSAQDGAGPAILLVEDSFILDNEAGDHGSVLNSNDVTTVVFTNVVASGNTYNQLAIGDSDFRMVNSTVVGNQADGLALLDFDTASNISVLNSILWDSGGIGCGHGGGSCEITYSIVEGGWPGAGNLDADPLFVDPAGGDYHLRQGSPGIDSATDAGAPDHDLDGTPRPIDGDGDSTATTDMGAFESPEAAAAVTRYVDGVTGSDTSDCSDPLVPCQTIGHAIGQAVSGDELHIAGGTYLENLVIDGKGLLLRGGYTVGSSGFVPGRAETIIDGGGVDRTLVMSGGDSTLHRLTVTGGQTPEGQCWGGGMTLMHGNFTIRAPPALASAG